MPSSSMTRPLADKQASLPLDAEVPRALWERAHRQARLTMPLDQALACQAVRIGLLHVAAGLVRRRSEVPAVGFGGIDAPAVQFADQFIELGL
jgi:hypothetical protein